MRPAEVRLGLHGRTVTQLLLGEPVEVSSRRLGRVVRRQRPRATPAATRAGCVGAPGTPVDRLDGRPRGRATATCLDGDPAAVVRHRPGCATPGRTVTRRAARRPGGTLEPSAPALDRPSRRRRAAGARRGPQFLGRALPLGRHAAPAGSTAPGWCTWPGGSSGCCCPATPTTRPAAVTPVPLGAGAARATCTSSPGPGERIYHVGFVTRPVADDGTRRMLHAPETGGG